MKGYAFEIVKKDRTARNCNYYVMNVTLEDGEVVQATYFGNTTPTEVTKVYMNKYGYYQAEIQPHTSRDRDTGMFKGSRKVVA
ncbi:MAG: hypothetical protein LUD47_07815 [Clostridia bacterium]|nr:hypothetical protein [Clostridia bacterium]